MDIESLEAPAPRRPPAVLFLLSSLVMGGSERKTVRLVNALWARGWNVQVAYIDSHRRVPAPLLEELEPEVPRRCLERRWRYSPPAVLRLRNYLRQQRITAIVCVNLHPLFYAAPLLWGRGGRDRPTLVALINTTDFRSRRDALLSVGYRWLLRLPDRIVFGCRHQARAWMETFRVPAGSSVHIYNGTDTQRFRPPPKQLGETAGGGELRVGMVAQLRPEKNHRELLLAIQMLLREGCPVRLRLIGSGSEYPRLRALARSLGIERQVEFLGEQGDVRPALAWMDVFVLTSSRVETFSNAALEAMAMAKPVILTRVGGAQEMVTDGHDGFTYPSGEPARLAELLKCLAKNPEERRRLGENARRTVELRFSFARMVRDFEELLKQGAITPAGGKTAQRSRRSIVVLATEAGGSGGVAAVISGYQKASLQEQWAMEHIVTHCDGSVGCKLATGGRALFRYLSMLLHRQVAVAHVHTASRMSFLRKSIFIVLSKAFGIPVIVHLHGAEFDRFYRDEVGAVTRFAIRAVLRSADKVIVLSDYWRQFMSRVVDADRVVTISNAVALPQPGRDTPRSRRVAVLFLGRIGDRKGFFDLLEAVARLVRNGHDIELLAAGDGEVARAAAEVSRLGIASRVHLLGWLNGPAKEDAMRRADVFCLPSYAEGLPMALLEAMSVGMPVITSPVGGVPEAVSDQEVGYLVPPGDVDALEAALRRLVTDPGLRQKMGAAARRRIETRFSLQAMQEKLEVVYRELGA